MNGFGQALENDYCNLKLQQAVKYTPKHSLVVDFYVCRVKTKEDMLGDYWFKGTCFFRCDG